MNSISAQYDPINADTVAYLRLAACAESRDDAVDELAADIGQFPKLDDFADALGSIGFTQEHLQKLLRAYMNGREQFMTEVYEQLDAAFRDIADLKLTRIEQQHCAPDGEWRPNVREILSDWE